MTNEEMFNLFMQELKGLKQDVTEIKLDVTNLKQDVSDVKAQLDRIEDTQQLEVFGMLKVVDKKITNVSYDIDYLREQSSRHDMDIERLKKRIQS